MGLLKKCGFSAAYLPSKERNAQLLNWKVGLTKSYVVGCSVGALMVD